MKRWCGTFVSVQFLLICCWNIWAAAGENEVAIVVTKYGEGGAIRKTEKLYICGKRIQSRNMSTLPGYYNVKMKELLKIESIDPCQFDQVATLATQIKGRVVLMKRNESCFYTTHAYNFQQHGAYAVMFDVAGSINVIFDHNIHPIHIVGVTLSPQDAERIQNLSVYNVGLYDPQNLPRIDPNQIVMVSLAVFCLCMGMLWAVNLFTFSIKEITQQRFSRLDEKEGNKVENMKAVTQLSIVGVLVLFVIVLANILLAFYFPVVISYFVLVIYAMAGLSSITICFIFLMELLPSSIRRLTNIKLYKKTGKYIPTLKMNFVVSFALAVVIMSTYFITRYYASNYAWITQNLIGIAFCTVFVANVRVTKMHIITIIFILFFIYDVFFVFITPHIDIFNPDRTTTTTTPTTATTMTTLAPNMTTLPTTSSTTTSTTTTTTTTPIIPTTTTSRLSVMEVVALGLGTNGDMPLVLILPHFLKFPNPCNGSRSRSILGLGDITIPGFLASFCAMFDLVKDNQKCPIYSITFILSYIVGLGFTMIALAFMERAQPALLYILPIILLTFLVVAAIKGDIGDAFRGNTFAKVLRNCHEEKKNDKKKRKSAKWLHMGHSKNCIDPKPEQVF